MAAALENDWDASLSSLYSKTIISSRWMATPLFLPHHARIIAHEAACYDIARLVEHIHDVVGRKLTVYVANSHGKQR